ncbi:GNAT family N-acetyltransferase [Phreatobacter stygius]|nr:GNAT family N-acetyltransferase [Phreatobacter stygius]
MVPDLTTARLLLRQRDIAEIDDYVAMDGDLEVRRHITPEFRDNFDADAYRVALAERMARDFGPGFGHWTLRSRVAPHGFLGMAILMPVEGRGPEIEIGWRLPRSAWGQGHASEAARCVLDHAFATLGLEDVVALIDPQNSRSIAVAAKLGFSADGRRAAYGTEFDLYRCRHPPGSRKNS